jgi:hypothetical protein
MMRAAAGSAHHQPSQALSPTPRSAAPQCEGAEGTLGGISDECPVAQGRTSAVLGQSQGRHDQQGCRGHGDTRDRLAGPGLADEVMNALGGQVRSEHRGR